METQLSSTQTQPNPEPPSEFQEVLSRTGLSSPQQLRDQVIFSMLSLALSKMELDDDEKAVVLHQEKLFRLAQRQQE